MGIDAPRVSITLTVAGVVTVVSGLTMGVVGALLDNPVLLSVPVLSVLLLAVSALLTSRSIRSLSVQRVLPPELYARQSAHCRYIVHNHSHWLAARGVCIEEQAANSRAVLGCVLPKDRSEERVGCHFSERGVWALHHIAVFSRAPFGLLEVRKNVPAPVDVVVYPALQFAADAQVDTQIGEGRPDTTPSRHGDGELASIRPYRIGDPLRRVHWLTSARVGTPQVILRTQQRDAVVIVQVDDAAGYRWEENLSKAAGSIDWHIHSGMAVGLSLDGQHWPARRDPTWRRVLLEQLARAAFR